MAAGGFFQERLKGGQEGLARRGFQEFFEMTGDGSQRRGESSKRKKTQEREGSSDDDSGGGNAVKGSALGEEGGFKFVAKFKERIR